MRETYEQIKARLQAEGVIKLEIRSVPKPEEPVPEIKKELWEIRKLTLPVNKRYPQGKVVVYGVTKEEANWWIVNKLKVKSYQDDATDMKTIVMYEKFLIDGTPKERNIYSNPARFCTEEFPDFKGPTRIN